MHARFIIQLFMPSQCMNNAYFNDAIFYNRLCSFLNLQLHSDSKLRVWFCLYKLLLTNKEISGIQFFALVISLPDI